MSACNNFLSSLDSGARKECHPSFCVTTISPKGCLLSVPPLFHVRACTVLMCLLKKATSQHKYRLTILSEVMGEDETAEECGSSALSLITCWDRCLRVAYALIFLPPLGDPGSSSVTKTAGVGSSHMKQCRLREYGFRVKGGEASHSRVHMRPLINCFTCSDSQLSQPPVSVMILLSTAFVSCCVCSCMINPPFLSSTTEISYWLVITTQKCAELHRENIYGFKKIVAQLWEQKKGSS